MKPANIHQRLLAILKADGVGYSRLMSVDAQATVQALDAAREVFKKCIADERGRVIDTAGDSVLAVFDSASSAVSAALATQRALARLIRPGADDAALRFRMGVHLGDVFLKDDGTVYGDGVNVASRLEALAEPGGTSASQSILAAVDARLRVGFEDIGEQVIKNIAQPIRVFRIDARSILSLPAVATIEVPAAKRVSGRRASVLAGAIVIALAVGLAGVVWWDQQGAASSGVAGKEPTNRSEKAVAVLPFANQSDDKGNGYFAEGVSDEMLNLLSRVPSLRVSAKSAASHFAGATVPLVEVARQLGVAYLVTGTVRRSGERVRISVELVNGANGSIIWADSFDREIKDVLVAQTDLAIEIARSLRIRIDASSLAGSGTRNAEAWRLFRQGESMPLGQREEFFNRALQADPKYARVHAALALEVLRRANRQTAPIDRRDVYQRAVAHANEALRIDPACVQAYVLLAYAAGFVGDSDAFQKNASRVMQLDPDEPDAHELAADSYLMQGRMDESLSERKRVTELDPLEPIGFLNYAWTLLTAGRPAQALVQVDRAIALAPDNARSAAIRARILLDLNRPDEALAIARQAVEAVQSKEDALRVLSTVGAPADIALANDEARRPSDVAALDLYLGRGDAFLSWLETTEVTRVGNFLFDPALDSLRDTPRYRDWLVRTNLAEAQERATTWRAAHRPSLSGSK